MDFKIAAIFKRVYVYRRTQLKVMRMGAFRRSAIRFFSITAEFLHTDWLFSLKARKQPHEYIIHAMLTQRAKADNLLYVVQFITLSKYFVAQLGYNALWIQSYYENVMTKFMSNNWTDV